MNVLVCGASGCVGAAVANALRSRGHRVVAGVRRGVPGERLMHVDFMEPVAPAVWATRLRERRIDAVVNCVGILIPRRGSSFERIHAQGPIELFRGAALAGVKRVLQVSALGVGSDAQSLATPYLHSKLRADDALAGLATEWAVLRPALISGPGSQSGRLFATLASLPLIGLPGRGQQAVAPVHVFEVAEAAARLLEQAVPPNAVFEIGGPRPLAYRAMLEAYRDALGLGPALWLPVPMWAMRGGAALAEALPQTVFSRDTLGLLERGPLPSPNALPALLGRAPSSLAQCLAISRPEPLLDLRVVLAAPLALALRASLGFMWLYTALISAWLPQESGVLALLARCGFTGGAGVAALVFSCVLNTALGVLTVVRPGPLVCAAQLAAVAGYSAVALVNMPALAIDHCGPLVKNLPVAMLVLLLWLALPPRRVERRSPAAGGTAADHSPNSVSSSFSNPFSRSAGDAFPCNSTRPRARPMEEFLPVERGA